MGTSSSEREESVHTDSVLAGHTGEEEPCGAVMDSGEKNEP